MIGFLFGVIVGMLVMGALLWPMWSVAIRLEKQGKWPRG